MQIADEATKQRLLSCAGAGAGGFLTAPPVSNDLRMGAAVFIDAVRFRLGIRSINAAKIKSTHVCLCNKVHDQNNLMSDIICCPKAGGSSWIRRHDIPKNKFAEIARQSGHSVTVESRVGDDERRYRTDVTINDFHGSAKAELDFAVTHPLSKGNLQRRCIQGIAAEAYAKKKVKESGLRSIHAPDVFIPAIFDTYGLIHPELVKVIHTLAENHINQSATDAGYSVEQRMMLKGVVVNGFMQRLSIAVMKGVVYNIDGAAKAILRNNGRDLQRKGSLTTGRSEVLLSSALRAQFDSLDVT